MTADAFESSHGLFDSDYKKASRREDTAMLDRVTVQNRNGLILGKNFVDNLSVNSIKTKTMTRAQSIEKQCCH